MRILEATFDSAWMNAFIDLPYRLYRDDACFAPPLRLERALFYNRAKNPFFTHAKAAYFVCEHKGQVVGRISAQVDYHYNQAYQDNAGFFGSFECISQLEVAQALLSHAEAWLKQQGVLHVIGPCTMAVSDELGLLVDGFNTPPSFMTPHHLSYYRALIESCGYQKVKELYAWDYHLTDKPDPRAVKVIERTRDNPDLKIRPLDMGHFDKELTHAMHIFNEAWRGSWPFTFLNQEEVAKIAKDLKLVIDPRIALFAEYKGKVVGTAIGIPDLNQALLPIRDGRLFPVGWAGLLWRTKIKKPKRFRLMILGILPEFRSLRTGGGLAMLLCHEIRTRGERYGYQSADLSQTLDSNQPINHMIELMGGKIYKKYYVYDKKLA